MKLRILVQLTAVVVILALGIAVTWYLVTTRENVETRTAPRAAPIVRTQTVSPETLRLRVHSQGTVAPRTQSLLVARVAGAIEWTAESWASGGFFAANEPLLRIESADYELARAEAEARLAQAELALAREEEESASAREEWRRVHGSEDDLTPTPLVLREPQLREARASVAAAKARVQAAERDLERTTVRAPYAGRLRETRVDLGQYVTPGTPVGTVYAVDFAEIRLPIPDDQLAYLELRLDRRVDSNGTEDYDGAAPVELFTEFAGARPPPWRGQIVRTEGEIDPRSRMIHAVAQVADPYGEAARGGSPPLAVGLFVRAEILGRTLENVLSIPRHALREDDRVLVVESVSTSREVPAPASAAASPDPEISPAETHRLAFRAVHVVRQSGDTALLDLARSALSPGERICVSPLEIVVEGMPVRLLASREMKPDDAEIRDANARDANARDANARDANAEDARSPDAKTPDVPVDARTDEKRTEG